MKPKTNSLSLSLSLSFPFKQTKVARMTSNTEPQQHKETCATLRRTHWSALPNCIVLDHKPTLDEMTALVDDQFYAFDNTAYVVASRVTAEEARIICPMCWTSVDVATGLPTANATRAVHVHNSYSISTRKCVVLGTFEPRVAHCVGYAAEQLRAMHPFIRGWQLFPRKNSACCKDEYTHLHPQEYVFVVTSKTVIAK
jgi:hypothetical protein